jgi:cell division protein FtsN
MEPVGFLIGMALVAWLNHYLATQRGRNAIGWAFGGAIFGLLSTILLLILGKTKEKELEVLVEAQKQASK